MCLVLELTAQVPSQSFLRVQEPQLMAGFQAKTMVNGWGDGICEFAIEINGRMRNRFGRIS